ncbi:MAG: LysR substrate-binding domain-containing protein [Bacilli bacterium]
MKPQSGLRQLTDEFCRQVGFTPNIRFEAEEVATVLGLVNAGLGVAVLPKQAGLDYSHVSVLSIRPIRCSRKIYASWRKSGYMSQAVLQFKEFILSEFTN